MRGKIIYEDINGSIDRFIDQQFSYCDVWFIEQKTTADSKFTITHSDQHKFEHTFLIDGIKILERRKSSIKYEIQLISNTWFRCAANVIYSNYDTGTEDPLSILKNCMSIAGLPLDSRTFDCVKSNASLSYITSGDENLFSVFKYLTQKMYYFLDKDSSLKFLYLNGRNNIYYLFDLNNASTYSGSYNMVVSFFKSNLENVQQTQPLNFSVITRKPKSASYQTLFDSSLYSFDYDSNTFSDDGFTASEIVNFANSKHNMDNTLAKTEAMIKIDDLNFKHRGSIWHNDYNIYESLKRSLFETNSFVVNAVGDITCQPASHIQLVVDRSSKDGSGGDSPQDLENLKSMYQFFDGSWITAKVKSIIVPRYGEGSGNDGLFRQNLVLFRNFQNIGQMTVK